MPFSHPHRRPWLLICLLFCFALAGTSREQVPPDAATLSTRRLTWHWQPGKRYLFQTETETIINLKALGKEGEQVLQVIQNTDVTVLPGKEAGTKELKVRFVTLRARMAAEGKTFLYDSEEPSESDPAMRQMLADSSGTGFSLIYTEDDKFLKLGVVEQPAAQPETEPSLLQVADARQVAELYRRSLEMVLPRPDVAVGDKWTSIEQMTFPQAGDMDVRMNCHYLENLDRDNRPHAKVTFQGRIAQAPEVDGKADHRTVKLGGDSTIAGHIFYDLERRAVSLSMFLGSIVINHEGKNLPVRQSVTTRLEDIVPAPES